MHDAPSNAAQDESLPRLLAWALTVAVVVYVVFEAWLRAGVLAHAAAPLVLLTLAAASAARLATREGALGSPRAALTFVLAALAVLPPPCALLVAAVAAVAGGGGGVAGVPRRGAAGFSALVVAVAIAQFYAAALGWSADLASGAALARTLTLAIVIQGFTLALALTLDLELRDFLLGRDAPSWRITLLELGNVPLGWLLGDLLGRGAWAAALALSLLVLGAALGIARFERARAELGQARESLERRQRELVALQALGKKILTALEPARVFTLVDRECRKLFEMESCTLALVDRDLARPCTVYRRQRGGRTEELRAQLDHGPAGRVLAQGVPLRLADPAESACGDAAPNAADSRAVLLAPLAVDTRVIGLLRLESARGAAYDDEQLALFTALAQHAAVAIEHARTHERATVDSLTGFFLRDYFLQRLAEEQRRARRYRSGFALLMADLDEFKAVNDRHGHLAGDHYLAEIADTIREQLRAADLACRLGGDEFCLLLPETDAAGAQAIAERIRDAVGRRQVHLPGAALRATISIGVAVAPEQVPDDLQQLLQMADEALYRAKRAGRDRVAPFAA